jgi:anti-anti-sigma factor
MEAGVTLREDGEDLKLTTSSVGTITVTRVDGVLDATTRERFGDHLSLSGPDLVLDLTGVTFMDSRALGMIVYHCRTRLTSGGKFAMVGVDRTRHKVMWITGLARRLPLYDTLADALTAIG